MSLSSIVQELVELPEHILKDYVAARATEDCPPEAGTMSGPGDVATPPALPDSWLRGIEMPERICSVDGCDKPSRSRGWCRSHYTRWLNSGDPLDRRPTSVERFWAKVDMSGDCWLWTAGLNPWGYGELRVDRKSWKAHRFAYELLVGPIPDGLDLDHVCHSSNPLCPGGNACPHRRCVRPDHLEPVTHRVNLQRSVAFKTECINGHARTPKNVYVNRHGHVQCRACWSMWGKRYRAAR